MFYWITDHFYLVGARDEKEVTNVSDSSSGDRDWFEV